MIIEKLQLMNFRNYDSLSINFNEKVNIFYGKNGMGKTNILESIYVLSLTKSHRCNEEDNLIKQNKNNLIIQGLIKAGGSKKKHEIRIDRKKKMVFLDGKEIKPFSNYISLFDTIIFSPSDLEIIKGSPNDRRRYLNIALGQLSTDYIKKLNEYNYLLKMRNNYLRKLDILDKNKDPYLEILTDKMIEKAILIYRERYNFINKINSIINEIYEEITKISKLSIKYENGFDMNNDDVQIKSELKEKYNKYYEKEIIQGNTLYGPHRDDFSFYFNNFNVGDFGSQGQQRMTVLALKLAELEVYKGIKKEYPVLLLDDIFSELDEEKIKKLLIYLKKDIQIIITTTEVKKINKKLLDNAKLFKVENNSVEEEKIW